MASRVQVAGVAAETYAAAQAAGFIGWSPEPNRVVYTVQSGSSDKRGPGETPNGRVHYYR